ncbi:MAG: hypothetical protein JWM61_3081 [Micrococcaceae bacterium]|jgi:hypothetical protein|nr:hypothetical protein [Micrococcaceae bacterium]
MARPSPMPDGIRVHVRCAEVRLIRVFASIKARHTVNPYEQQWLTAQAASEATLLVDDVWVRYVVLGGAADAVAVAAYLHGIVLLDVLHRDLVSYAVNELLQTQPATRQFPVFPDSGSSPAVRRRAPYADESGPARNSVGRTTHTATTLHPSMAYGSWPRLAARLETMFNPFEAEHRRSASLMSTGLVQSGKEERFDLLTQRARRTFDASSATITFLEAGSPVVKSAAGLVLDDLAGRSTFCSHTITEDRILIIPDTLTHKCFVSDSLVVGEPHIRFYAGSPLTGPGGWRIGALCIFDTRPRRFSRQDERQLRILAALVQTEVFDHY